MLVMRVSRKDERLDTNHSWEDIGQGTGKFKHYYYH